MASHIETFKCPKCSKNVPNINRFIHEAQCKGEEDVKCVTCGLLLKKNEYNDHIFCHSLETQENPLQNDTFHDYYDDMHIDSQPVHNPPINLQPMRNERNTSHDFDFNINNSNRFSHSQSSNNDSMGLVDNFFSHPIIGGAFQPMNMNMMRNNIMIPFSSSVSTSTVYDPIRGIRITTMINNGEVTTVRQNLNGEIIPEISDEMLSSFPERAITKADLEKTGNLQKECVVCLSNFVENEKIITLPCLHIFHSECVKNWLKKGNPECPICKTSIVSN